MKKYLLVIFFLILTITINGQISIKDSTVQVIGYWNLNEKQSFIASYEKYKIKETDTIFIIQSTYEIDITVKDSTKNSYEIEWFYKNYKINSENKLIQKLSKVAENLSVIIKTDEFGAFVEVKNWMEIKEYIDKSIQIIKSELKDIPNINKIINQTTSIYSSKEAIEVNAVKDILQFYTFHGGKYLLHEKLTGNLKTHNNYGDEPFDTRTEVSLDEIDEENDNSVIRMYNSIDSEQLTEATFNYLKNLAEINGNTINKEDIKPLTNETWVASRIHGSTGWPIFSLLSKEITSDKSKSVEETIIELK